MKCVIALQSVSDIITNSSSEVFVVKDEYDGQELIDWDWIKRNEELEMIIYLAQLPEDDPLISKVLSNSRYGLLLPTEEDYIAILDKFKEEIQERIVDKKYWWADVEDYYDEYGEHHGGRDYLDYVWADYRH